MDIQIRAYEPADAKAAAAIWNEVVEDGFRMPDGSYADIKLFYHAL